MKEKDLNLLCRKAVETSRNIIIILDEGCNIIWHNNSFTENLLYSFDEVEGHNLKFLFADKDQFDKDHLNKALRWLDKEGNIFWVMPNHSKTEISGTTYNLLVANPISKWKNLEEVSKEQELLIDGFSNSFVEINIIIGHGFQILAFNQIAKRFFSRYLKVELRKGNGVLTGMATWMRKYMKKQINKAFDNEKIKQKRYVRDLKKYFNLGFFPISDSNGNVMGVSFLAEDVTSQERYLKRLRDQRNEIHRIAWENSHAIRNPVANLIGLTNWLHSNEAFDGEIAYMVRKILESSIDLDRKIKKLSNELEQFR